MDNELDFSSVSESGQSSSKGQALKKEYLRNGQFLFSEEAEEDSLYYGRICMALDYYYKGIIDLNTLAQTVTVGIACRVGDVQLTKLLLNAQFGHYPDDRGWFPMHEAAFGLHIDCCKALFQTNFSHLNAQAHDGVTPLLLVCGKTTNQEKACELAALMLKNGADVNLASLDGMTPLIQAIRSKNRNLIDILLKNKADPTQTWYGHWSALHEAACRCDSITMQALLEMGLDIFSVDDDRHTALLVAVQERCIPCVVLALEAAKDRAKELANICLLKKNISCVMAAVTEGYDDVLEILLKYGANCNLIMDMEWDDMCNEQKGMHSLTQAALGRFSRCLKLLLPHVDRSILATTAIGPMTGAAYSGSSKCIELLLESGYSTEEFVYSLVSSTYIPYLRPLFMRNYYCPLREAVRKGHSDAVKILLNAGAQMMYSKKCSSPFLFAFRNCLDETILESFIEHDVDLNFISEESNYNIPDALLSVLGSENRQKLLILLKCGLKPSLEYWCSCRNGKGLSLLNCVRQFDYVSDLRKLIELLAAFSSYIPGCCREIADLIGQEPKVASLSHLCRVSIRRAFKPSLLLNERWMAGKNLPEKFKKFIRFDAASRYFF
uniref:SOCS box domain-containing protein n=1 Tax=Syphacia muris TaxID=451379 RepID=A0A0N5AJP1_9BILA